MSHNFHTIQFTQNFNDSPLFFADMQSANGTDPADLRLQDKDRYAVEIKIDEEQSLDDETEHTKEVVGYMAFSF